MYIGKTAFQMMLIYNIGFIGLLRAPLMMFGDPLLHLTIWYCHPKDYQVVSVRLRAPLMMFGDPLYCISPSDIFKDYQDFDDANEDCRLSEFLGVELKGSQVKQVKQIKSMLGCSDLHWTLYWNIFQYWNSPDGVMPMALLAPKELYTWYCPMTIQRQRPLFEHTPVLNDNFEYWCLDDFVDCDFCED